MLINPPLGLYIHIPWCVRKCPYCDFNSHAAANELPELAYVNALLDDLADEAALVGDRPVETVFIGGGTPSLFSAAAISRLLDGVRARVNLDPAAEINVEANPGTAESGKFAGFREAGVNRLSIGVQSFGKEFLERLGRIHGRDEAIAAAAMARGAGFTNFNLDLMFGLPGQDMAAARADLETAVALEPTHLSYYQLTLEPNTLFHKYPPTLPEDEAAWEMQQAGIALLAGHGYQRYEVSAYAREGRRCRHNVNYWRFGDYLGIGAGAHGKITDIASGTVTRRWKIRHPQHFLDSPNGSGRLGGSNRVPVEELPFEFLMNQLRLRDGFALPNFAATTGLNPAHLEPALTECVADGLLEQSGAIIRCTDRGYDVLDEILQRFLPEPAASPTAIHATA